MAHLRSRQKLGFYPTPPRVARQLRALLAFPARTTALDPCCGAGEALAAMTADAGAITYGIEPDRARAAAASQHLTHTLRSTYEDARVSHGSVGFMLLNPPYDDETGTDDNPRQRAEARFLTDTLPWLAVGGILAYLIPQQRLSAAIARTLTGWFSDLQVWRFPDPEYASFRQIIAVGVKRASAISDADARRTLEIAALTGRLTPLPDTPATAYPVPALSPLRLFRSVAIDPEELAHEAAASPVWSAFWRRRRHAEANAGARPPLPLHRGHLSLLLAAGDLDGLVGDGADRHIVRGLVRKRHVTSVEAEEHRTITRTRDVFNVEIKMLTATGALHRLTDAPPEPDTPTEPVQHDEPATVVTARDEDAGLDNDPTHPVLSESEPSVDPLTGRYPRHTTLLPQP